MTHIWMVNFFSFGGGWGCWIFFVPNVFPTCSPSSQYVHQQVPNNSSFQGFFTSIFTWNLFTRANMRCFFGLVDKCQHDIKDQNLNPQIFRKLFQKMMIKQFEKKEIAEIFYCKIIKVLVYNYLQLKFLFPFISLGVNQKLKLKKKIVINIYG